MQAIPHAWRVECVVLTSVARRATLQHLIRSFRHKGLRAIYRSEQPFGIDLALVQRVRRLLLLLDSAEGPADARTPGGALHPLRGDRRGTWSIRVTGRWRLTFRFVDGDVTELDLEDYH